MAGREWGKIRTFISYTTDKLLYAFCCLHAGLLSILWLFICTLPPFSGILIRLWESKYSPWRLEALYELVCVSVLRLYGARKTQAWWIVHLCSTTLLQTHPTASTDTHMCTHSPVRWLSHLEGVMGVRSFPMVWMTRRPHTHRPAQMPIPP